MNGTRPQRWSTVRIGRARYPSGTRFDQSLVGFSSLVPSLSTVCPFFPFLLSSPRTASYLDIAPPPLLLLLFLQFLPFLSFACPCCRRRSDPRCLCSTRNLPLVNYASTIVLGLLRANWESVVVIVISSSRLSTIKS